MPLRPRPLSNTANARLLDAIIRHSHFIEMFSTGEQKKILRFLEREIFSGILDRFRIGNLTVNSKRRLERFLISTRGIIDSSFPTMRREFRTSLLEFSRREATWTRTQLAQFLDPVKIETQLPSPSLLRASVISEPMRGQRIIQYWNGISRGLKRSVEQSVRIGLVEGETTPQIISRLRQNTFNVSRHHATSLVRTAVRHTSARARQYTFKKNENVVEQIRYVATLDARTTFICMGLDGKTFPIDSGPRPPQHHQCRSDIAPVLKSWEALGIDLKEAPPGTRASFTGQVPATETYNSWLKRQDKAFQNDVLGPERASLFRSGMHIDRFTNSSGRTLTLEELYQLR